MRGRSRAAERGGAASLRRLVGRFLEIPFRGLQDADDESLNESLAWMRARFGKID